MAGYRTRTLVVLSVGIAIAISIAIVGRWGKRPLPRAGSARQLKKSEMTAAEQKYGIAPIPDSSVTYQPDVIVVGGGADAVRSLSSTGLTWTIDAHAPHAGELAVGKIIFLTNRAVGRVLDIRNDGGNLAITLGPAALTEIIRDCDIRFDPIAIDFGEAIAYEAPDLPGRVIAAAPNSAEVRPWGGHDADVRQVALTTESGSAGSQQAPMPDVSNLVNFKIVPTASLTGLGLRGESNGGGLKVKLEAFVHIIDPTLIPALKIDNGRLIEGTLTLTGGAGLTIMFETGTDVGRHANVNGRLQAVPDFSLPVVGASVPLALTVRQQLIVKTALGVKNSTLSTTGEYGFRGAFVLGYKGNAWTFSGPGEWAARQSVMQGANGISIAASGLNLTHQLKIVFGVGAFGLAAGPYFNLNSAVGLFKGSDLGMLECKEATLVVGMSGGVGYLIPKPVEDAINFVLGTLHITYRIDGQGGLETKPINLYNSTATLPACKAGKSS